jgi:hypothetical protein
MKNKIFALFFLFTILLCAHSAKADFIGSYDVANWTTTVTPGSDAAVSTSLAPLSLTLTSGDNGIGLGFYSIVSFTIPVAATGILSFHWDYDTYDVDGSEYDPFGYLLNGVFTPLTTDLLFVHQSGDVLLPVSIGDIFGFQQDATDSIEGSGVTTISAFSGHVAAVPVVAIPVAAVPEPATFGLMTLGLIGFVCQALRRKTQNP